MTLKDKLAARLTGSLADKERRDRLLAQFLAAFEAGGEEAASEVLQAKLTDLERAIRTHLAALEIKLP